MARAGKEASGYVSITAFVIQEEAIRRACCTCSGLFMAQGGKIQVEYIASGCWGVATAKYLQTVIFKYTPLLHARVLLFRVTNELFSS